MFQVDEVSVYQGLILNVIIPIVNALGCLERYNNNLC